MGVREKFGFLESFTYGWISLLMALAVFSFLKWEGRCIEEFSLFFGSKNPDGRDFGGYLDQMFCGAFIHVLCPVVNRHDIDCGGPLKPLTHRAQAAWSHNQTSLYDMFNVSSGRTKSEDQSNGPNFFLFTID